MLNLKSLKLIRKRVGFTQAQIADLTNNKRSNYTRKENGLVPFYADEFFLLLKAIGERLNEDEFAGAIEEICDDKRFAAVLKKDAPTKTDELNLVYKRLADSLEETVKTQRGELESLKNENKSLRKDNEDLKKFKSEVQESHCQNNDKTQNPDNDAQGKKSTDPKRKVS